MSDTRRRQCILVLGMHRSGTSASTRLLALTGARLPSDIIPPQPDNPAGFWESNKVLHLNEALLTALGTTWREPIDLPPTFLDRPEVRALRREAANFLHSEFGDTQSFVLKDPRMCRLVPFWLAVLADIDADAVAIVTLRPPHRVARSLQLRDGMKISTANQLWLEHMLMAERETRGIPRTFLSFEALLREPVAATERVARALDLSLPDDRDRWRSEVTGFIDTQMANRGQRANALRRIGAASRAAAAVYRRLVQSSDGELSPPVRDFLDGLAGRIAASRVRRLSPPGPLRGTARALRRASAAGVRIAGGAGTGFRR